MSKGTQKLVAKLKKYADNMQKTIDSKFTISDQNPTAKRARMQANRERDGENLKILQARLRALAEGHETETIHPLLKKIKNKKQLETLMYYRKYPNAEWDVKIQQSLDRAGITKENYNEVRILVNALVREVSANPIEYKIKKLERKLLNSRIDGFFPTPLPIIEQMFTLLDINPNDTILEPSAGKGDIAEQIKKKHPNNSLETVEPVWALREILELKGFKIVNHDFMKVDKSYDIIVMNPPFERFQDIDHVRHAYSLLNKDGQLVSIMGEGTFFRTDKKAVEFRDWLEGKGWSIELPKGSFKKSGTGVTTRLVMINKGDR